MGLPVSLKFTLHNIDYLKRLLVNIYFAESYKFLTSYIYHVL